jgi:hypothetical protein
MFNVATSDDKRERRLETVLQYLPLHAADAINRLPPLRSPSRPDERPVELSRVVEHGFETCLEACHDERLSCVGVVLTCCLVPFPSSRRSNDRQSQSNLLNSPDPDFG